MNGEPKSRVGDEALAELQTAIEAVNFESIERCIAGIAHGAPELRDTVREMVCSRAEDEADRGRLREWVDGVFARNARQDEEFRDGLNTAIATQGKVIKLDPGGPSERRAFYKDQAAPKPKPEPQPEPRLDDEDEAAWEQEEEKAGAGFEERPCSKERFNFDQEAFSPVLSKSAPMDNAKAFARDRLSKNGVLATYHYHNDWWQWNGQFYEKAPHDRIMGSVYGYLDGARNGDERFKPRPENAEALIKCLKACVAIDDRDGPPRWLDGRSEPPAENLLPFENGLVNVETGELIELTPKLWIHGGVDFAYDPGAGCPRWERFKEEIFPGDAESQACVEEQLGYGMTNDTRFEKGALWIGQKRSGKSTLAWVQERLAGVGACASLNFHDWMKTENSRAHLIGKKVGIFADVRLKPPKQYGWASYDPGGLDHQSAQFLLNIIGRDKVSLGRKFKDAWEGRLAMKVIITSNEVPNLQDGGGVLISRFIMLEFKQSFFGREDVNLRSQLERELPGIANRCLVAYRRLCARGGFFQPAGGKELVEKVEKRVNPYAEFMDECFVEADDEVVSGLFLTVFKNWCRSHQRFDLIASATGPQLIKEVKKIKRWSWLKTIRPHGEPRRYPGIKIKDEWDNRP